MSQSIEERVAQLEQWHAIDRDDIDAAYSLASRNRHRTPPALADAERRVIAAAEAYRDEPTRFSKKVNDLDDAVDALRTARASAQERGGETLAGDEDKCEGCDSPATTIDNLDDAVPLCAACKRSLVAEQPGTPTPAPCAMPSRDGPTVHRLQVVNVLWDSSATLSEACARADRVITLFQPLIARLEGDRDEAERDVDRLKPAVNAARARVAELEAESATLRERVAALESQLACYLNWTPEDLAEMIVESTRARSAQEDAERERDRWNAAYEAERTARIGAQVGVIPAALADVEALQAALTAFVNQRFVGLPSGIGTFSKDLRELLKAHLPRPSRATAVTLRGWDLWDAIRSEIDDGASFVVKRLSIDCLTTKDRERLDRAAAALTSRLTAAPTRAAEQAGKEQAS